MLHGATIVRLFVASPADTSAERRIVSEVVEDVNRLHGRAQNYRIDLLLWEDDAYPGAGVDAQSVINERIGDYDVFVGLMNTRFGAPTLRSESGTVEEFERAYQNYLKGPNRVRILFYFRDAPVKLSEIDLYQALQVQRFRQRIGRVGILYKTFETLESLRRSLSHDLPLAAEDAIRARLSSDELPTGSDMPSLTSPSNPEDIVELDNWHTETKRLYPQWATYREIPIERYGYKDFELSGQFQSESCYFRFGFKLFGANGHIFGYGSIQSHDANILLHLGKNTNSEQMFLTSYINGIREQIDQNILDYSHAPLLRIRLIVRHDGCVMLAIGEDVVYESYVWNQEMKRLVVVAWGDEHLYSARFTDVILRYTHWS